MNRMKRREFVQGRGLGAAASNRRCSRQAPAVRTGGVKPVVIASANGNRFKNGGPQTGVERAFKLMTSGGADVLDALIAGVNIVELDPADTSVGYGGLPNADGVVQLDSCCMHGPKKRAGGVAALEGVRTPSQVAQAVMDTTDHHLLVGKGAQDFARNMGFTIEDDLNTEKSRQLWLEWKRRVDPEHYLDPKKRGAGLVRRRPADGARRADRSRSTIYGTINCDGINARARSAASRRRAAWRGRFRAASAIRRFSAPACTWTAKSARPDRPDAAKRISTTCARS